MSRRRRKNKERSRGGLRKTVFCPMCGTTMRKADVKKDQHATDSDTGVAVYENGQPVLVTRVFYWCPFGECHTVIWFDYRQDGKEGELHKMMNEFGEQDSPLRLGGKFDQID